MSSPTARARKLRWNLRLVSATAVSAALIIPLTACSTEATNAAKSDTPIEIWTRSGDTQAKTYQKILAAFTADTGIKVTYKPVADFDTQLVTRATQKNLPDLFINDAGSLGQYVALGYLKQIDRTTIKGNDQLSDANWQENLGTDGKIYGVPFSRQAAVMTIRKDWREKLNLPIPKTWDDVTAMATAFATKDPDGDGKANTYGMVVPGTAQSGYIARWGSPYLWQAGGDIVKQTGGKYTSVFGAPETKRAMEWIRTQFCTPGNVVPGSINLNTTDALGFSDGKAGMYLTGAYQLTVFDKAVGKENVEVVPMPHGPKNNTTFAEGENVYFASTSKNPSGQKALAEYLITEKAQKIGMDSPAAGGPGPFTSVVRLPVNTRVDAGAVYADPRWGIVADAYRNQPHAYPWNINFIPLRQIVADNMNAMMADCNSDIPALIAKTDTALKAEIARQGI